METKNVAIICIWAFMIALLIYSVTYREIFLFVFILFFIAMIVTIYLVSASEKNKRNYNIYHINSKSSLFLMNLVYR
jgi:hypothetical protein